MRRFSPYQDPLPPSPLLSPASHSAAFAFVREFAANCEVSTTPPPEEKRGKERVRVDIRCEAKTEKEGEGEREWERVKEYQKMGVIDGKERDDENSFFGCVNFLSAALFEWDLVLCRIIMSHRTEKMQTQRSIMGVLAEEG